MAPGITRPISRVLHACRGGMRKFTQDPRYLNKKSCCHVPDPHPRPPLILVPAIQNVSTFRVQARWQGSWFTLRGGI